MKIHILIFFFTFNIFSQNSIKCIYKVIDNKSLSVSNIEDDAKKNATKLLNKALKQVDKINYELIFNKNESLFKKIENIAEDINDMDLYILEAMVSSGVYYQNRKKNTVLHQNDVFGELFIIQDTISSNWNITNEYKYIKNYKCYKATNECISCNKKNTIEVWFAPSINVPFGPKGYGNLPGLILEVKMKTVTLQLDKILFNQNIKIEKPKKGKLVSLEEYKKLSKKLRSDY